MSGQVDVEAAAPLLVGELLELPGRGDACVQDDRVEAAEALDRGPDRAVDDGGIGQIARDRDCARQALGSAGETVVVDVGEEQMRAPGRQVVRDVAADAGGGAGDEHDVAGELGRRRRERQLVELERPILEVMHLGFGEPARAAEAVEGGGNRGVRVRRDLGPRSRCTHVGPGRDDAEARDEHDPVASHRNGLDVDRENRGAPADPEHVVRRAPDLRESLDIGPVGEATLIAVRGEDDAAVAGKPAAEADEKVLVRLSALS